MNKRMNKWPLKELKTTYILHSCRPLRIILILPKESLSGRNAEGEAGRGAGTVGFHFSWTENFP